MVCSSLLFNVNYLYTHRQRWVCRKREPMWERPLSEPARRVPLWVWHGLPLDSGWKSLWRWDFNFLFCVKPLNLFFFSQAGWNLKCTFTNACVRNHSFTLSQRSLIDLFPLIRWVWKDEKNEIRSRHVHYLQGIQHNNSNIDMCWMTSLLCKQCKWVFKLFKTRLTTKDQTYLDWT